MLIVLAGASRMVERLEHRHQRHEHRHYHQAGHVSQEPARLVGQELDPPPHDSISFTRRCTIE